MKIKNQTCTTCRHFLPTFGNHGCCQVSTTPVGDMQQVADCQHCQDWKPVVGLEINKESFA